MCMHEILNFTDGFSLWHTPVHTVLLVALQETEAQTIVHTHMTNHQ